MLTFRRGRPNEEPPEGWATGLRQGGREGEASTQVEVCEASLCLGLSRSAGLGSPKGQDGLNYWPCSNSAWRLRSVSLSPPSTLLAEWGGSRRPSLATRALRKASDGRVEVGRLPWAPGPLWVQTPMVGSLLGPILLQAAGLGLPGCLFPDPFSERSSRPFPSHLPVGLQRRCGAWRRRAFLQKGLRSSLSAQLFPSMAPPEGEGQS